jgi:hypothetical protein
MKIQGITSVNYHLKLSEPEFDVLTKLVLGLDLSTAEERLRGVISETMSTHNSDHPINEEG